MLKYTEKKVLLHSFSSINEAMDYSPSSDLGDGQSVVIALKKNLFHKDCSMGLSPMMRKSASFGSVRMSKRHLYLRVKKNNIRIYSLCGDEELFMKEYSLLQGSINDLYMSILKNISS